MKEEAYYRARRITKAKKSLRSHAIVTVAVVVCLGIINAMTGGESWVQWPMLPLGISLGIHALTVFGKIHLEQYEEKTMKKEMKKYGAKTEEDEYLELDNEQLELDELPELRKEWKDSDFV